MPVIGTGEARMWRFSSAWPRRQHQSRRQLVQQTYYAILLSFNICLIVGNNLPTQEGGGGESYSCLHQQSAPAGHPYAYPCNDAAALFVVNDFKKLSSRADKHAANCLLLRNHIRTTDHMTNLRSS